MGQLNQRHETRFKSALACKVLDSKVDLKYSHWRSQDSQIRLGEAPVEESFCLPELFLQNVWVERLPHPTRFHERALHKP
jgi:hypothetical protein